MRSPRRPPCAVDEWPFHRRLFSPGSALCTIGNTVMKFQREKRKTHSFFNSRELIVVRSRMLSTWCFSGTTGTRLSLTWVTPTISWAAANNIQGGDSNACARSSQEGQLSGRGKKVTYCATSPCQRFWHWGPVFTIPASLCTADLDLMFSSNACQLRTDSSGTNTCAGTFLAACDILFPCTAGNTAALSWIEPGLYSHDYGNKRFINAFRLVVAQLKLLINPCWRGVNIEGVETC